MGSALEDLDLVAFRELHDRPLPVRLAPDALPHPLVLPAVVRRPHSGHLDAEQRLNGLANLQLVGVGVHLEVVLPAVLVRDRARFGDERPHDGAMKRRHRLLLLPLRGLLRGRLLRRGLLGARLLRRRLRGLLGRLLRRARGRLLRRALGGLLRRTLGSRLHRLLALGGTLRRRRWTLAHRQGLRGLLHRLERLSDRARLDEHDVRPQDVVGRAVGERHHVHVREVPTAEPDVLLHAVREHEHLLVRHAEARREREQRGGARRVVVERVDHDDRAFTRAGVERALLGEHANLARDEMVVRARRRTEDGAAAHPLGRTRRALTGAARSLLLPGLLITARDVLADLRRRVALPLIGEERGDGLVHHGNVDHAVERRLGKRHLVGARRAERRVRGRLWSRVGVSHGLPLLANDDDPVRRAGYGAADVDQIALGVHLLDPQADLGVPLGAVVTRHLLALDDARRIRAGSDRARAAVLRVAVRVRSTAEAPALHHALEAATLGRAGDLHLLARREDRDVDPVADGVRRDFHLRVARLVESDAANRAWRGIEPRLPGVAELRVRRAISLGRLLALGVRAARALRARAELQRLEPARVRDREHRVGLRLDHGARDLLPRFVEQLGHAQLLADDADHGFLC